MYEGVKQSVLDSIEENKYEPRRAIKRLNPGQFTSMSRNEEGREEVTRMVADMAGEPIPMDEGVTFTTRVTPYIHNYSDDLPVQFYADLPQEALFDPSLTAFQGFDFGNGFDIGEFGAGAADI
jgi:hypothetical protein